MLVVKPSSSACLDSFGGNVLPDRSKRALCGLEMFDALQLLLRRRNPRVEGLGLLGGAGDLVSKVISRVISYKYPKWSYPNYNATYKRLTKSPAPPSKVNPRKLEHGFRISARIPTTLP